MATFNDGTVLKILDEIAASIVDQAKRNSSWSKDIPKAISFDPANVISDGYEVVLKVDASRDGPAPQAAAFEFGSGIHRTRGTPGTYEIKPRNASVLAIPESSWPNFQFPVRFGSKMLGYSEDGNFILSKVDHPGVAARPFMTPAIIQKLPEARQLLKQNISAILQFGGKVEVIG